MTDEEIDELGTNLEHSGLSDDEIDSYLEHVGVKGMKWGQRKSKEQKQARARAQQMGTKDLKSEHQRIQAHGGGLKGTLRLRQEMVRNGEITKQEDRNGKIAFGLNITTAILGGIIFGRAIAKAIT